MWSERRDRDGYDCWSKSCQPPLFPPQDGSPVDSLVRGEGLVEAEFLQQPFPPQSAHLPRAFWITGQGQKGSLQFPRRPRRHHQPSASVLHHLGNPPHVTSHHRDRKSTRLN